MGSLWNVSSQTTLEFAFCCFPQAATYECSRYWGRTLKMLKLLYSYNWSFRNQLRTAIYVLVHVSSSCPNELAWIRIDSTRLRITSNSINKG